MHFYGQLDCEHIPSPSPSSPYANPVNNNCGDRENWIGVFSNSRHCVVVARPKGPKNSILFSTV